MTDKELESHLDQLAVLIIGDLMNLRLIDPKAPARHLETAELYISRRLTDLTQTIKNSP